MLDDFRDILLEAYRFTNGNEVMQAIAAKRVGAKIDPSFLEQQGSIPTKLAFENFFKKCNQLGIKDTVYGVQILVSKCTRQNISQAVQNDGLYEFLRSYRKPWVKELQEYKDFLANKFNPEIWHNFEKAVQAEQTNHGNVAKGSGNLKDVKEVYNDGTWRLLIPSSFEGAKAASYYIKDGKETPTKWCTRCDKEYYDSYTEEGPLYIIRNMKTGKSYQMAFEEDCVDFLDQNDVKGDEITNGDLTKIPDNLLKLIKSPFDDGRTLLDYKNNPQQEVIKKGRLSSQEAIRNFDIRNNKNIKLGKEIELSDGVVKREILNYTNDYIHKDRISNYFNDMTDTSVKKDKATKYYFKDKPEDFIIITIGKGFNGKRVLDPGIDTENIHHLSDLQERKLKEVARKDIGWHKHIERAEKQEKAEDRGNLVANSDVALDKHNRAFLNKLRPLLNGTNYKEILDVHIKGYTSGVGGTREMILPNAMTLINKNGEECLVEFKNDNMNRVKYNEATLAWSYEGDNSRKIIKGNLLNILKRICTEYTKMVMKLPEFQKLRMVHKSKESLEDEIQRKTLIDINKRKNMNAKQAKRAADDAIRDNKKEKEYNKEIKPFSSIQTEEVRYFNY